MASMSSWFARNVAIAATRASRSRWGSVVTQLLCEHLLKGFHYVGGCAAGQSAQTLHKPITVYRSNLVERDEARSVLKATGNAPGVRMAASCHRCDDHGAEVLVQLIR